MSEKFYEFIVKIPAVASKTQTASYIKDAVESWSGQFHPDNPMFGAFHDKVRVRGVPSKAPK